MTDNKRWYQHSEMLVALAALITSIVAVVVGVYSAWIDRSFARASTWPHVEIYRSYSDSPAAYSIVVLNQGTGPAIVRYAIVEQDGERFPTWADWLARHHPESDGYTQSHIGTRVLSPEQTITAFDTRDPRVSTALRTDDRMNLTLCYCSVFEQCWLTDRSNEKQPVDDCEPPTEGVFRQ